MNHYANAGYLEIIIGGMYAGKTSRLIEIYKQCKMCNIQVCVINHSSDTRYDDELLSSHDHIKIPCIKTTNLLDIWEEQIDLDKEVTSIPRVTEKFNVWLSDVILINEAQFFPDLEEFVRILLNKHKKIYICGLDGDFERKKFGQILDLIPLCDKVTKLTSLCMLCKNGTPGIFTKRIGHETEQTLVGTTNYIPVCRKCYLLQITNNNDINIV